MKRPSGRRLWATAASLSLVVVLGLIWLSAGHGLATPVIRRDKPQPVKTQAPASASAVKPSSAKAKAAQAKPGPLAPNENGQIMILMYHNFLPKSGDWNRTPDEFRGDLERLYKEGYRLVNLRDVLDKRIKLPRGYTPVVLTFDDGWQSQFNYVTQDGKQVVDPNSAVGILLDFQKKHPDMGLAGTFFVNAEPFGVRSEWKQKLAQLVAWGFEIGNHTYTHANLRKLDNAGVTKELAEVVAEVRSAVPGYQMDSVALPFGVMPKNRAILRQGEAGGESYSNRAVLLVGANPAPAPGSQRFDPLNLPRVQGSTVELDKWLSYFEHHPDQRYVTDGE